MKTFHTNIDGTVTITGEDTQLSTSELKSAGLPFTLNGTEYIVPLDAEGQNGVNSIAIMLMMNLFDTTVFNCTNGVKVPLLNSNEAMTFCMWFADERRKFFK